MSAERLLAWYDRIADAPDAVARLRRFILDLAVRGRLVPQDPRDKPATELLKRIEKDKFGQGGLPKGWRRASVGALLDFQYGKGLKASERKGEGPVPVFGSNGVVGFTDTPLTVHPSIIVGRKGSAGAVNLCDGPSWTTDVAYFVEPPSFFTIQFLLNALTALQLDRLGKGVKPGLSRSDAYEQVLCVPPLAEQHRIVAKVDELMALCDHLEAARATRETTRNRLVAVSLARLDAPDPATFADDARFALDALPALTARPDQIKALRQTILNLAVRGKLAPQNREKRDSINLLNAIAEYRTKTATTAGIRLKPIRKPVETLDSLPPGWQSAPLGNLVEPEATISYGVLVPGPNVTKGVPFVRAQDLSLSTPLQRPNKTISPEIEAPYARTRLKGGEILICVVGSIGKLGIAPPEWKGANIARAVARISPVPLLESAYLIIALQSDLVQSRFAEATRTLAQPTLNVGLIEAISIPLPPLAEQHRIVAKVDELMALCDRLEAGLATAADTRSRLLDALLADALAPTETILSVAQ